jgi:hypothetical protein
MSVSTATAIAAQILSNTLSLSKTVREQAKQSKDADLKAHISDLYDSVLSLKEAVMLVTDENNELRRRNAELEHPPEKPVIKQVGAVNYYFVGEKGPYCQPCYADKRNLVELMPPQEWSGGIRRKCEVCGKYFYEKPPTESLGSIPLHRA